MSNFFTGFALVLFFTLVCGSSAFMDSLRPESEQLLQSGKNLVQMSYQEPITFISVIGIVIGSAFALGMIAMLLGRLDPGYSDAIKRTDEPTYSQMGSKLLKAILIIVVFFILGLLAKAG